MKTEFYPNAKKKTKSYPQFHKSVLMLNKFQKSHSLKTDSNALKSK